MFVVGGPNRLNEVAAALQLRNVGEEWLSSLCLYIARLDFRFREDYRDQSTIDFILEGVASSMRGGSDTTTDATAGGGGAGGGASSSSSAGVLNNNNNNNKYSSTSPLASTKTNYSDNPSSDPSSFAASPVVTDKMSLLHSNKHQRGRRGSGSTVLPPSAAGAAPVVENFQKWKHAVLDED